MREYLFRGKRKDNGEWVYGFVAYAPKVLTYTGQCFIMVFSGIESGDPFFDYHEVIPETFCQFTGHQVNDISLYESDIVRNEKMEDEFDTTEYMVCVFIKEWAMFGLLTIDEYHEYNQGGAEVLDESLFWTFPIYDKDNEQRRICGNIHSNPELLNI